MADPATIKGLDVSPGGEGSVAASMPTTQLAALVELQPLRPVGATEWALVSWTGDDHDAGTTSSDQVVGTVVQTLFSPQGMDGRRPGCPIRRSEVLSSLVARGEQAAALLDNPLSLISNTPEGQGAAHGGELPMCQWGFAEGAILHQLHRLALPRKGSFCGMALSPSGSPHSSFLSLAIGEGGIAEIADNVARTRAGIATGRPKVANSGGVDCTVNIMLHQGGKGNAVGETVAAQEVIEFVCETARHVDLGPNVQDSAKYWVGEVVPDVLFTFIFDAYATPRVDTVELRAGLPVKMSVDLPLVTDMLHTSLPLAALPCCCAIVSSADAGLRERCGLTASISPSPGKEWITSPNTPRDRSSRRGGGPADAGSLTADEIQQLLVTIGMSEAESATVWRVVAFVVNVEALRQSREPAEHLPLANDAEGCTLIKESFHVGDTALTELLAALPSGESDRPLTVRHVAAAMYMKIVLLILERMNSRLAAIGEARSAVVPGDAAASTSWSLCCVVSPDVTGAVSHASQELSTHLGQAFARHWDGSTTALKHAAATCLLGVGKDCGDEVPTVSGVDPHDAAVYEDGVLLTESLAPSIGAAFPSEAEADAGHAVSQVLRDVFALDSFDFSSVQVRAKQQLASVVGMAASAQRTADDGGRTPRSTTWRFVCPGDSSLPAAFHRNKIVQVAVITSLASNYEKFAEDRFREAAMQSDSGATSLSLSGLVALLKRELGLSDWSAIVTRDEAGAPAILLDAYARSKLLQLRASVEAEVVKAAGKRQEEAALDSMLDALEGGNGARPGPLFTATGHHQVPANAAAVASILEGMETSAQATKPTAAPVAQGRTAAVVPADRLCTVCDEEYQDYPRRQAAFACDECGEKLCPDCWASEHKNPKRARHAKRLLVHSCLLCSGTGSGRVALYDCEDCSTQLCLLCWDDEHRNPRRAHHGRRPLYPTEYLRDLDSHQQQELTDRRQRQHVFSSAAVHFFNATTDGAGFPQCTLCNLSEGYYLCRDCDALLCYECWLDEHKNRKRRSHPKCVAAFPCVCCLTREHRPAVLKVRWRTGDDTARAPEQLFCTACYDLESRDSKRRAAVQECAEIYSRLPVQAREAIVALFGGSVDEFVARSASAVSASDGNRIASGSVLVGTEPRDPTAAGVPSGAVLPPHEDPVYASAGHRPQTKPLAEASMSPIQQDDHDESPFGGPDRGIGDFATNSIPAHRQPTFDERNVEAQLAKLIYESKRTTPQVPWQSSPSGGKGNVSTFSGFDNSMMTGHRNENTGDFLQSVTSAAMAASEGTPVVDPGHRRRLMAFYQYHNPSKLPVVVPTLVQYRGHERELFEALVQKYGPEPPASYCNGPLPLGWHVVESRRGDVFYKHLDGRKQWERPLA